MTRRRHPSKRTLQRWLDGHDTDDAVDTHVVNCNRCAARLEGFAEPVQALGTAVAQSLQAPDDLVRRLGVRMDATIRSREDVALFFELMGVPLATVRSLMEDDDS